MRKDVTAKCYGVTVTGSYGGVTVTGAEIPKHCDPRVKRAVTFQSSLASGRGTPRVPALLISVGAR